MKKALIVTAMAGFIRGFLMSDIEILKNIGYEIHLAANANNNSASGINFHKYFEANDIAFYQIDFSSTDPFSIQTLKAYKQLKKLIDANNYDVVHCHTPIAGALARLASRKHRKKGTRVIYTSHGFYFHKGASRKTWLLFYSLERLVSKLTDVIITINKEDYKCAQTMHCNDVRYINGMGVDVSKFRDITIDRECYRKSLGVKSDEIMVLSVGELSARKNHQVIIKAIAKLGNSKIVYVICGKVMNGVGTYEFLKDLAVKENVQVIFLGFRRDIPEICKCADIGALPSTREGLGLSGIEILASGVPLIASKIHGIVDYVTDGSTGYLCGPYDVDGFANAISCLLKEGVRDSIKENCINVALSFDISVSVNQRKAIYESILKQK